MWTTIAMAVVVFIGFSRTFYLRFLFPEAQEHAAPEPVFVIHGAFLTAWMLLLVAQALLISRRRVSLHRSLGWVGAALALAVVVLGIHGAMVAAQRPGGFIGVPFPPLQFLVLPFLAMVFFGALVGLAITWRNRPQYHKRLMLLATVNLLEAAIIRIPLDFIAAGAPFTSFGFACLFIVALAIYDKRVFGKLHRVTLWGGLSVMLSQPAGLLIMNTKIWNDFAAWLVQTVG